MNIKLWKAGNLRNALEAQSLHLPHLIHYRSPSGSSQSNITRKGRPCNKDSMDQQDKAQQPPAALPSSTINEKRTKPSLLTPLIPNNDDSNTSEADLPYPATSLRQSHSKNSILEAVPRPNHQNQRNRPFQDHRKSFIDHVRTSSLFRRWTQHH